MPDKRVTVILWICIFTVNLKDKLNKAEGLITLLWLKSLLMVKTKNIFEFTIQYVNYTI